MPWFMSCENESMESVLKRIESDVLNHRALKSRGKDGILSKSQTDY